MGKIIKPLWGWYEVLSEQPGHKIKYLHIEPGKCLSMQRHFKRSEHWFILEGELMVDGKTLKKNDYIDIPVEKWHRPYNISNRPCLVLEIQFGEECIEEDIERKEWKKLI